MYDRSCGVTMNQYYNDNSGCLYTRVPHIWKPNANKISKKLRNIGYFNGDCNFRSVLGDT